MIALDSEERAEYERLCRQYQRDMLLPQSPTLAKSARDHVAWRRAREAMLARKLEAELRFSWLDKLGIYGAYRVLKGNVMINRQLGNWQTTVIGFIAALMLYLQQNGGKLPTTWPEWQVALLAAAVAALGFASKDAATGSLPGARGSVRLLALPLVGLIGLSMLGCGDKTSVNQLTCFNSGPGMQQCIDGDGNVTASPCTTVNGALVTSTGQACDASSSSTTVAPTPAPTGAS